MENEPEGRKLREDRQDELEELNMEANFATDVAKTLANDEALKDIARQYGITEGKVSILVSDLADLNPDFIRKFFTEYLMNVYKEEEEGTIHVHKKLDYVYGEPSKKEIEVDGVNMDNRELTIKIAEKVKEGNALEDVAQEFEISKQAAAKLLRGVVTIDPILAKDVVDSMVKEKERDEGFDR